MMAYIGYFVTILVCLICAVTDCRTGKVYNKVTYPAILFGLVFSLFSVSPNFPQSIVGILGSFLLYGLFWGRGLGAGDIKLMIAVGALQGLPFVIYASFYILCIAAVFSILLLAWKGRLVPFLKWFGLLILSFIPGRSVPPLEKSQVIMLPLAPFILIGVLIAVYLEFTVGRFSF